MATNEFEKSPYHCSFCDKASSEVIKLIAGPQVFICNECVDLCNEILREEWAAGVDYNPKVISAEDTEMAASELMIALRYHDANTKIIVRLKG